MNWKIRAGIIGGIILLIAILAFIIWWQYNKIQEQKARLGQQSIEMQHLKDDVVRSKAEYVSKKDLKNFAKKNDIDLKPIQKDIKKLDAEIQGISKTLAQTPGLIANNLASTNTKPRENKPTPTTVKCPDGGTVECPSQDPFGYLSATQVLELSEPFNNEKDVPWGKVDFQAWKNNPWGLEVYPRQYKATTVLSQDEDGRHFVHNKLSIITNGEEYSVPIASSEFVEKYPQSSFRFDPTLQLGVDAGFYVKDLSGEVMPNLQLALFSYGKTKINPSWTFLGLGIGYETQKKNIGFILSPVNYNLGEVIPLVNNLYIGPSVSIDPNKNVAILGGIRVEL